MNEFSLTVNPFEYFAGQNIPYLLNVAISQWPFVSTNVYITIQYKAVDIVAHISSQSGSFSYEHGEQVSLSCDESEDPNYETDTLYCHWESSECGIDFEGTVLEFDSSELLPS